MKSINKKHLNNSGGFKMPRNNRKKLILPDSELQVMQIIWNMEREQNGNCIPITAGAMFEHSPEVIGHLKLTTVLTLITRLISKGCIKAVKEGRANYYIPLIKESDYRQTAADEFVATVYKNDTKSLISALLGNENLSVDDIKELRKMIEGVNKGD